MTIDPISIITSEDGFGLVELLIAMVSFRSLCSRSSARSAPARSRSAVRRRSNTAAVLATSRWSSTARCPTTRSASTRPARPTTGTYVGDTTVCPASPDAGLRQHRSRQQHRARAPGAARPPRGRPACPSTSRRTGSTRASRTDSSRGHAGSPDGRDYYVDTYIKLRRADRDPAAFKQISVVCARTAYRQELVKVSRRWTAAPATRRAPRRAKGQRPCLPIAS